MQGYIKFDSHSNDNKTFFRSAFWFIHIESFSVFKAHVRTVFHRNEMSDTHDFRTKYGTF